MWYYVVLCGIMWYYVIVCYILILCNNVAYLNNCNPLILSNHKPCFLLLKYILLSNITWS